MAQNNKKFDTLPYECVGLDKSDIQEIKQYFDIFDQEHRGYLNPSQLKYALGSFCQVIIDLDTQAMGKVTFEEFIHLMTPKLLAEDSRQNIDKIFRLYDFEMTGYISLKNLRRISKQIGEDLSEQDLQLMIQTVDKDEDGLVSQQQFYELLSLKRR